MRFNSAQRLKQALFLLLPILFITQVAALAQVLKPATWQYTVQPQQPKVGDVVEVIFDVTIENGWYIYSNDFDPDLGPIPTTVAFDKNEGFQPVGKLKAINPKKKYDDIWGGDITYFTKKGRFVQKLKVLKENPTVSGLLDFQTCTEKDGSCVPGKEKFTVKITTAAKQAEPEVTEEEIFSAEDLEGVDLNNEAEPAESPAISADSASEVSLSMLPIPPTQQPEEQAADPLWKFLLLAFGAGIASIFMPCIYPIMPMTVSYFTKQQNGKSKVIFYGLSIMAIFAVIGLVTMAFGAPFLNFISTHWLPNLIFFIIFILFGISLLGGFEIVLPHETVNKIDRMSDRGGYVGIFFMALTLVVVSFSCTVPFVGSLLIMAAGGEVLRPLYGMLAFGLPFALVFTLLATFPQYLKKMPKSGGWLNELKVVFGFLEFALALKFLSNIDLAYGLNLLPRNTFLVLWIIIFTIIGLYILGYVRLPKDTPVTHRSPSRIAFAVAFLGFAAYMIPGVEGKPLKLLSGILPPLKTSTVSSEALANENMSEILYGLQGFHDFDDALAYAKEVNKPILIDFTGHACANCRKMEENVWPQPEVMRRMKNDFVIASLYVDDKKALPTEKHYVSEYDGELKTTVGDKNMDLEITKFNNNAQPYYAIVTPNGESLVKPLGYVSTEEFIRFLDEGTTKFEQ